MTKSNGKRGFTYRSYNFLQDPVLDIEKSIIQRSGLTAKQIHEKGGATAQTIRNHFNHRPKSARFNTLAATIRAAGGDIQFVAKDGQIIKLPQARTRKGWIATKGGQTE